MIDINSLRYRGLPVFWHDGLLFAAGHSDAGQQLAWEDDGQWCAFKAHDGCVEVGRSRVAATEESAREAALQCLIDNGVLTVVNETPAATSMKFIRLPAPLPWKANEILRTADVNAIYGDVSTYTVDMPAAKADAIVALLLLLDINAKSYEV